MNFFRDEKGYTKVLGDWLKDEDMYVWKLEEACEMAFGIFEIHESIE